METRISTRIFLIRHDLQIQLPEKMLTYKSHWIRVHMITQLVLFASVINAHLPKTVAAMKIVPTCWASYLYNDRTTFTDPAKVKWSLVSINVHVILNLK